MIPRTGTPPRPGLRHRLRPGAYAIVRHPRGLLLTEQSGPNGPVPELQLPGGGVDPGESALPALHREALEETGHRIRIVRRLGAFRRFTWMPEYRLRAEKLCTIYLADAGPRLGEAREPGHRAVILPAPEALHRLAVDGDRMWLARAMRMGWVA